MGRASLPPYEIGERLDSVRAQLHRNVEEMARLRENLSDIRAKTTNHKQVLRDSLLVRLYAKLETLPVIEQAKGILIANSGCTPEEAFQILRRASQRTNVRVKDIAEGIVNRAVAQPPKGPGLDGASPVRRAAARQLSSN